MKSGWIILDKPSGMTSRTAGGKVARMFGVKKFGHLGTLDPMASGVLPIALGEATKMIPYLEELAERRAKSEDKLEVNSSKLDSLSSSNLQLSTPSLFALRSSSCTKEYRFSIKWGIRTDTDDITGKVLEQNDEFPDFKYIENACDKLIGECEQTPPAYSAIHIDGQRAYELARRGIPVEIPKRKVTIHNLEFDFAKMAHGGGWEFSVKCSAGTYVRSIARDIARLSGGYLATVDMIRRMRTHNFDIKDAKSLDFLENLYNNDPKSVAEHLHPIDFGLDDILVTELNGEDARLFQNGNIIITKDENVGVRRAYSDGRFIGIGQNDSYTLSPRRIIKE
jgi:tRNA pseudouridine55 synthase